MSHLESELLIRITHMDGEKQSALLDYIRNLDGGRHSQKSHRGKAMLQIRKALKGQD